MREGEKNIGAVKKLSCLKTRIQDGLIVFSYVYSEMLSKRRVYRK